MARKVRSLGDEPSVACGTTNRWLLAAGLMLAALSPFIWLPWVQYSTAGRLDAPRTVTVLLAASLLACWMAFARTGDGATAPRPWLAALCAVAGVSVLSAAVSAQPAQLLTSGAERSFMAAPVWLALAAIAGVAAAPAARALHRPMVIALVLGGSIAVAAGTYESVVFGEVGAGYGSTNFFGAVAVSCVPLALLLARTATGWRAASWLAAIAVLVWGVALAQSVASIAVLAAQALVVAAFLPGLLGIRSASARRVARIVVIGVVALCVTLPVAWFLVPDVLPAPVNTVIEEQVFGPTFTSRLAHWEMAARIWLEHPFLGVGPDGIDTASQLVMTERFVLGGRVGDGIGMLMRDPHNLPLLVLASSGLVGAAAALWLAVVWLRSVISGLRRHTGLRQEALALLALGTASLFACMLLVPWTLRYGALPAVVAGVALATAGQSETRPRGFRTSRVSASVTTATAAGMALVWVALAASTALGQAALTRSYLTMNPAEAVDLARSATRAQPARLGSWYRLVEATGEAVSLGLTSEEELPRVYSEAPDGISAYGPYDVALGRAALDHLMLRGASREFADWSLALVDRAYETAPMLPEVRLEAGRVAALRGDAATATELIDSVGPLGYTSPRIALYRYYAAMAAGDQEAAAVHATTVERLSPELRLLLRWGSI